MNRLVKSLLPGLALLVACPGCHTLATRTESDPDIRPGPGVASMKKLSAYLPSLANTHGDILPGREFSVARLRCVSMPAPKRWPHC